MSNSIATRENAIMVAGAVKAKAPILQFVNKELSGEFKNGNGSGSYRDRTMATKA